MNKTLLIGLLLFASHASHLSAQNEQKIAERFLTFLNTYQSDSLDLILDDSFVVERSFVNVRHDKTLFLKQYITWCKMLDGHYEMLRQLESCGSQRFLVRDQSYYFDYLGVKPATWILSIYVADEKVVKLHIGATDDYLQFQLDMKERLALFETWLNKTYPNETLQNLYEEDGLLLKRLKEYGKGRKG